MKDVTNIIRVFNFGLQTFFNVINYLKSFLENPIFKAEYLSLLRVGILIGYSLSILFVFLLQFNKIKRTKYMNKIEMFYFKGMLLLITISALSLLFLDVHRTLFVISFVVFILISILIDRVREHLYTDTKLKTAYIK